MGPWRALAAVATVCTAAATDAHGAGEGQFLIPPALKPLRTSEGDATLGTGNRQYAPGVEDCEDEGTWSFGSFLVGLAIGIALTLILVVAPVAFAVHRRQAVVLGGDSGEGGGAEKAKEDTSSSAFAEKSAQRLEADPGLRRKTEPACELKVDEAAHRRGCTEEVESMHLFFHRALFLVVMLLIQSVSSLILAGFEGLIQHHTDLIYFLTMIVGLGGNAGGQSMVLSVRGLAIGKQVFVRQQFVRGLLLSTVLVPLAFGRVLIQRGSVNTSFTVALSCLIVLATSTSCGTAIPRILLALRVDPAHGAAMIQVLMDIGGIAVVCTVAVILLGG